jgi:hypothetical protein
VITVNVTSRPRTIIGLVDTLGDFGGVTVFSYATLNFLFSTWAEFQFYLKAIQKLFNVRTRTPEIFR